MKNYMRSPEVLCFMTPLPSVRAEAPSGHRSEPYSRAEQSSGSGKGKGKNKFQSKGAASGPSSGPTIKEMLTNMPDGCASKLPNGQWLCVFYNRGICKHQKKARCHLGLPMLLQGVAQRSDLTLSVSTDLVSRNKTIQFSPSCRQTNSLFGNLCGLSCALCINANAWAGKFFRLTIMQIVSKTRCTFLSWICHCMRIFHSLKA